MTPALVTTCIVAAILALWSLVTGEVRFDGLVIACVVAGLGAAVSRVLDVFRQRRERMDAVMEAAERDRRWGRVR